MIQVISRVRLARRVVGKSGVPLVMVMIVAAAISSAAQAGVIRADRPQQSYLNLGANPAYASVGRLDFSIDSQQYIGSGTLIASNWVLTAAHCVDDVSSMQFTIGGASYMGTQWLANPSWNGNLGAGYDIGLVQLDRPVEGINPATLYAGNKELKKQATFAGYGMTGTGLTGATTFDGQKRAGQNMLDVYLAGSGQRVMLVDFDNPNKRARDSIYGSSVPLNLEYLIAPGDSGGGVFENFGPWSVLVGVNSFGAAWDGKMDFDYGDLAGVTRVSAFTSWVSSYVSDVHWFDLPRWMATPFGAFGAQMEIIPEPASISLLVLAGLAVLRRKRR